MAFWHPHIAASSFGLNGFDTITGTAAHTGEWYAIVAIGGDAAGNFTMDRGSSLTAHTIYEGTYLYGPCTGFTLSSGTVFAYRSKGS